MYFLPMIDLAQELADSFQEISCSESAREVEFKPSAELSYFAGHFPQMAVLPAVGIVDISQFFLGPLLENPRQRLTTLKHLRIKAPISPGEQFLIRIQKEEAHSFNVLWLQKDQKPIADLSLTL